MNKDSEFIECDACANALIRDTSVPCRGCRHNRSLINALRERGGRSDFMVDEIVKYSNQKREDEKTIAFMAEELRKARG